jgi:ankyrin repeat protein
MSKQLKRRRNTEDVETPRKKQYFEDSTSLIREIQRGNTDEAKKIITSGRVDINEPNKSKHTALDVSTRLGNIEIVKLLLKHSLDVKSSNIPLYEAVMNNQFEIFKLLVEHGMNLQKPRTQKFSLLFLAIKLKAKEIVEFLLDSGITQMNLIKRNHSIVSCC